MKNPVVKVAETMIANGNDSGRELLRLAQVADSPQHDVAGPDRGFDPSSDHQPPQIAEFAHHGGGPRMLHTVMLQFHVPADRTNFQEEMLAFLNKFAENTPGAEFVTSQWKMEPEKLKGQ